MSAKRDLYQVFVDGRPIPLSPRMCKASPRLQDGTLTDLRSAERVVKGTRIWIREPEVRKASVRDDRRKA